MIAEELNVKQVVFHHDESPFVTLKAKPNFRVLGKKVGKLMKSAQAEINQFTHAHLSTLQKGEPLTITVEGESVN